LPKLPVFRNVSLGLFDAEIVPRISYHEHEVISWFYLLKTCFDTFFYVKFINKQTDIFHF